MWKSTLLSTDFMWNELIKDKETMKISTTPSDMSMSRKNTEKIALRHSKLMNSGLYPIKKQNLHTNSDRQLPNFHNETKKSKKREKFTRARKFKDFL